MNPKATEPNEVHECLQKERLTRIDNAMFGTDGSDGLNVRIARMEVRLKTVLKLNWFLATTVFLSIVSVAAHYVVTK